MLAVLRRRPEGPMLGHQITGAPNFDAWRRDDRTYRRIARRGATGGISTVGDSTPSAQQVRALNLPCRPHSEPHGVAASARRGHRVHGLFGLAARTNEGRELVHDPERAAVRRRPDPVVGHPRDLTRLEVGRAAVRREHLLQRVGEMANDPRHGRERLQYRQEGCAPRRTRVVGVLAPRETPPRGPATTVDRRGVAGSARSQTLLPIETPCQLPRLTGVARSGWKARHSSRS